MEHGKLHANAHRKHAVAKSRMSGNPNPNPKSGEVGRLRGTDKELQTLQPAEGRYMSMYTSLPNRYSTLYMHITVRITMHTLLYTLHYTYATSLHVHHYVQVVRVLGVQDQQNQSLSVIPLHCMNIHMLLIPWRKN